MRILSYFLIGLSLVFYALVVSGFVAVFRTEIEVSSKEYEDCLKAPDCDWERMKALRESEEDDFTAPVFGIVFGVLFGSAFTFAAVNAWKNGW